MRYRKELKNLSPYKPGKPIEEVKRVLNLKKVYKLASNESPFAPKGILKSVIRELNNINRYPQGDCYYLRSMLSEILAVSGRQIVFGNGSDEIIVFCLRALIEKGDEVVVGFPTFLVYELQAKISGAVVKRVPLENFTYDLNGILKAISRKTKIVFIANPDNPTGTYLNHKKIAGFLKKVPRDVCVFFDEAYREFAPPDMPRSLSLLRHYPNIIIARTFSKAYGLAGMRIGYAVTNREFAGVLNLIREPFNVNRLAQAAAISVLKDPCGARELVDYTNRQKSYLYGQLKECGLSYVRSASNFVLVDYTKDTSALAGYLLKKGVIIRTLADWGLPGFFRVTVGLPEENKAFIKALKDYLKNSQKV